MSKSFKKIAFIAVMAVLLVGLTVSTASAAGGHYHTVHYGDTLFSLGRSYGVSPYAIADANGIYNPNHIYAGEVLYIPEGYGYGYQPVADYHDSENYYVVRRGDTLFHIGRIFGVNPYAIADANGIYNPHHIYAGEVLHIPSGSGYGYGYGHSYEYPTQYRHNDRSGSNYYGYDYGYGYQY